MQSIYRLLVISLCLINSVHAATVNPEEADGIATEETGGSWDAAGESSAEAWEKTKEASGDAWEATKKSSGELWDNTKEFSSDAWDATKEGSTEAWESTREWVNGSDEKPGETDENITEDTGTEI